MSVYRVCFALVRWGASLLDHIVHARFDRVRRWPVLAISVAVVAGSLTWVAGSSVSASAASLSLSDSLSTFSLQNRTGSGRWCL